MSKSISKEMLYEEFFNEVYESTEYSEDSETFKYSSFISGLCSMTNNLLNKFAYVMESRLNNEGIFY